MGIVHNPDSEYSKEHARWNRPRNVFVDGLPGYGPIGHEPYPRMLYKAFKRENGRVECMDPPPMVGMYKEPGDYYRAEAIAKAFTERCQRTVKSDGEYEKARSEGWSDTPDDALAYVERLEREMADAAAEAQAKVKAMTAKAQAEYKAADDATDAHVADIPAPKKGGRPRQTVSA